MSQVLFRTRYGDKNIEVMAGWDPPLSQYFMTIFDLDAEDEEVLYSSIYELPELHLNTNNLEKELYLRKIDVPEVFWDTVRLREDGSTIRHIR
jgi:hypothetical protein